MNPILFYFRSFHRLTNWHNVGLIVVVKMLGKSGQDTPYICVANTHLVYNPNRGRSINLFASFILLSRKYHQSAVTSSLSIRTFIFHSLDVEILSSAFPNIVTSKRAWLLSTLILC